MKTITLRLDDEDHKLFAALAESEDMPVATLIRRVMRRLAREQGLLATHAEATGVPASTTPSGATPRTQATTQPLADTLMNNEALLKRVEAGEPVRAVADSAGLQVSDVQTRTAKARKARTDGSLKKAHALQAFMQANPCPDPQRYYSVPSTWNHGDGTYDFEWTLRKAPAETPAPRPGAVPRPEFTPADPENPTKAEQDAYSQAITVYLRSIGLNP